MLNESKKQTPSKQDMEYLAKSLHAMQDEIQAVARQMGLYFDPDHVALWDSLHKAYTGCQDAAGMLETVLSHKEVDA